MIRLILFATFCQTTIVAAQQPPNIVIILADDMGYGDVHAMNPDSKIPTPSLDSLIADGMTFTDGHSPSAVCTPTRYGLLTGRYCWRTRLKRGVLGGYSPPLIAKDRSTIATMLKKAGYQTGAVGKWHLGMKLPMKQGKQNDGGNWSGDPGVDFGGKITDSPIHHGFDYYFGVSASLDMAPYVYIRNDAFTALPSVQQNAVGFPHYVREGPRAKDFIIDEVLDRLTQEATAFITKAASNDKPYFLYMPLTAPHKPTQPHPRFQGKTTLAEYGDFIAQVDWTVGEVLKSIEKTGEAENTLVIYSSDNGSYMHRYDDADKPDHTDNVKIQGFRAENHRANGPWRGTKADIYEAGHRVPLLVRWPTKVKPGSKCDETVCLTDLYATCAAATEIELTNDEAEDSVSLLALAQGETTKRGVPVISHSIAGMFAIRDGNWKLIAGNGSGGRQAPKGEPFAKPFQLYDLASDPAESTNLAEKHPEIVERLTNKLNEIRNAGRSVSR